MEKDTFRRLITVNGVGPKGALAVMNTLNLTELTDAVMSNDVKSISKAPGIGSKTAQKIIIELKDKLTYTGEMLFGETVFGETGNDSVTETAEALESLGFSRTEALKAIRKINGADKMDTEELLKAALKAMKG
jgi:Holliday junction DNA helicase RuvA